MAWPRGRRSGASRSTTERAGRTPPLHLRARAAQHRRFRPPGARRAAHPALTRANREEPTPPARAGRSRFPKPLDSPPPNVITSWTDNILACHCETPKIWWFAPILEGAHSGARVQKEGAESEDQRRLLGARAGELRVGAVFLPVRRSTPSPRSSGRPAPLGTARGQGRLRAEGRRLPRAWSQNAPTSSPEVLPGPARIPPTGAPSGHDQPGGRLVLHKAVAGGYVSDETREALPAELTHLLLMQKMASTPRSGSTSASSTPPGSRPAFIPRVEDDMHSILNW